MDERRFEPFTRANKAVDPDCGTLTVAILTDREDVPPIVGPGWSVEIIKKETLGDLTCAVTQCRLEILRTVQQQAPQSLYALAKILGKNQAYIYRESKALVELGLLEFRKEEGQGRRKTKPVVPFDALLFWV